MKKNVLVILGHPDDKSFNGVLAKSYVKGAKQAGAKVKKLFVGNLKFDPILHKGYKKIQKLEPDLKRAQKLIGWADHLVFVYPIWWGSMPALLKGFFDRILMPNFAFRFRIDSWKWDKLLSGKSARLIITMDSPPFFYKWFANGSNYTLMKKSILGFCGIHPIRITSVGSIKNSSKEKRKKWVRDIENLGKGLK